MPPGYGAAPSPNPAMPLNFYSAFGPGTPAPGLLPPAAAIATAGAPPAAAHAPDPGFPPQPSFFGDFHAPAIQ